MHKKLFCLLGLLAAALAIGLLVSNPVLRWNNRQLRTALTAVTAETVTLNEIVPFQWDTVYTFPPYTDRDTMESVMGCSARDVPETVSEGQVQLVFVRAGQVTAAVCGYAERLGYDVRLDSEVSWADETPFSVERQNNIVIFRQETAGITQEADTNG